MITASKYYISVAEQPFPVHKICDSYSENNTSDGNYLKMETAHKMIRKFLIEKKMSKKELAELLDLNLEEFEKFNSVCGYKQSAPTASYRLLCLYCQTKWN